MVICNYTAVPRRWFCPPERPLATALAVQSNYLGWSFGSLIPNLVPNGLAMRTFGFWQAVVVSGCLPLFVLAMEELSPLPTSSRRRLVDGTDDASRVPLAGASRACVPSVDTVPLGAHNSPSVNQLSYREESNPRPVDTPSAGRVLRVSHVPTTHQAETRTLARGETPIEEAPPDDQKPLGVVESVRVLFGRPAAMASTLSYAILGGVGFALPAVQDLVFGADCGESSLGLSSSQTQWSDFVFIFGGVVTGVAMGAYVKQEQQRYVKRAREISSVHTSVDELFADEFSMFQLFV